MGIIFPKCKLDMFDYISMTILFPKKSLTTIHYRSYIEPFRYSKATNFP